MDFALTEEQEFLRKELRALLEQVCPREYRQKCDREGVPPKEAYQALAEHGWLRLPVPKEYGGEGGGPIELCMLLFETGRAFADLALWIFRNMTYGVYAILRNGTPEQKEFFIPKVANGEINVCFALTEPNAGSDAANIQLRAEPDGDGWVLNGEKMFTTGMLLSDYVYLAARTDSSGKKHYGISTFIVDTKTPGITVTPVNTLGMRSIATTKVHYNNVRIPGNALVGRLHEAWRSLAEDLRFERLCLSAARVGAAQAAFEDALEYAKQRVQFGRPIGQFQVIQHKLADMKVKLVAAEQLVWRYAWLVSVGKDQPIDAAVLKIFAAETYKQVADEALQIFGGYGYTEDFEVERHFRDSRIGTIGGGTSEIQKNIIAKELGL